MHVSFLTHLWAADKTGLTMPIDDVFCTFAWDVSPPCRCRDRNF